MKNSILLKNCLAVATVNNNDDFLYDADIRIDENMISSVGCNLPEDADDMIDCSGKVALPGFVNTHHHFFQYLTRNLPAAQDSKLFDWLVYHYKIWRGITPEMVYTSSLAAMAELLLTGCTTSADHHYLFPTASGKKLIDEQINAAQEIGMRFHPTRGSMSRGKSSGGLPPDDVVQSEKEIIKDSIRLIDKYHDPGKLSMCSVSLAPCSPFSITTELMRDTAALAREKDVHLHTHLCETIDEEKYCIENYNKRPLEYMDSIDWLGSDVWFAHGIYFNDDEIKKLGETNTGIAHCPSSNLRLGSGIAPVRKLLNAGARVGLAVDGSASNDSSNMLQEVQRAMLINRIKSGVDSMSAKDAIRIATKGGAEILGRNDIGSLESGKAADIALFDVDSLAYAGGMSDPIASLLFCGYDHRAWMTIVNGKILVHEKQLMYFDELEIADEVNKISEKLLSGI
ncbi:MAG: 8-oxoguanine deaminase [Chlamydiae bacterium]|nr:MAG: 8-oxoguanine deaminase [Chlamydiota bacterium]